MKATKNIYNPEKENAVFAQKLKGLFEESKIPQKKLAEFIQSETAESITRQSIGQWCLGKSCPPLRTIPIIAKFFNVSTDYLLTETLVQNPEADVISVCEYTGLSENSIRELHNGLTQMGGDETIAVIPFKVLDADRAYFRYLYLKDRNICKCIDEFFKKKDSKELIMLIYDYVFMADECNINSEDKELMFIALQYEIIDRLKHWRETSHNQNPKGDE